MKKLKISTISRVLKKNGFSDPYCTGEYYHFYNIPAYIGHLCISFDNIFAVAKSRDRQYLNVHIDTYFSYPKSLKDLQKIIDQVNNVYWEREKYREYVGSGEV